MFNRVICKLFIMPLCYFDFCHSDVSPSKHVYSGSNKILIDSMSLNFIDSVVIQIKDIIESNRFFH